ncbi:MAG TPA: class I SAM-dependent methyltransferase [bacterium]|jgi:ubiquinone/menaquinone biosynthesis C-methylase UbiE
MPGRSYVPALRFEALSRVYDPLMERWPAARRMRAAVIAALDLCPGLRVLELGCGPGRLAVAVKRRHPSLVVEALDADPAMIARARELARESGVDVDFREADVARLPTQGPFDRIYSTLVFHHLSPGHKVAALAEASRVLRTGGLLVIADFGRPRGALQAAISTLVYPLDGPRNTLPHLHGEFEAMVRAAFPRTEAAAAWRTMFGTIELLVCRKD